MELKATTLADLYLIQNFFSQDQRGTFTKTFHADQFAAAGLRTDFRESYYSTSGANVIRGMHFQLPPYDHAKLVYVAAGEIIDVVLDLRQASPTFKQFAVFHLKEGGPSLYIPSGFAHGFQTAGDRATVVYNTTSVYAPQADAGIRWDSFGFEWPAKAPIVSERDAGFGAWKDFTAFF
jgi:dTDP-4-dehydrorhamnose 3,5-epimerase